MDVQQTHLEQQQAVDESAAAVESGIATNGPAIDRLRLKTEVLVSGFLNNSEKRGVEAVILSEIALRAEDIPQIITGLFARESEQTLAGHIRNLSQWDSAEFSEVQASHRKTAEARGKLLQVVQTLRTLEDSLRTIPEAITLPLFDEANLSAPDGLPDEQVDKLVTEILKAYGHKVYASNSAECRNRKNNHFSHPSPPSEVCDLVVYQGFLGDPNLSGEQVRLLLLRLKERLAGDLQFRDFLRNNQLTICNGQDPVLLSEKVLAAAGFKTEPGSGKPPNLAPAVQELADCYLKYRDASMQSIAAEERMSLVREVGKLLNASLQPLCEEAKRRGEQENAERRAQYEKERSQSYLKDPVEVVKDYPAELQRAYLSASDDEKTLVIARLISGLREIRFYNLWRFRERGKLRESLVASITSECDALRERLQTEKAQVEGLEGCLARAQVASMTLPAHERSQIVGALLSMPCSQNVVDSLSGRIVIPKEIVLALRARSIEERAGRLYQEIRSRQKVVRRERDPKLRDS